MDAPEVRALRPRVNLRWRGSPEKAVQPLWVQEAWTQLAGLQFDQAREQSVCVCVCCESERACTEPRSASRAPLCPRLLTSWWCARSCSDTPLSSLSICRHWAAHSARGMAGSGRGAAGRHAALRPPPLQCSVTNEAGWDRRTAPSGRRRKSTEGRACRLQRGGAARPACNTLTGHVGARHVGNLRPCPLLVAVQLV